MIGRTTRFRRHDGWIAATVYLALAIFWDRDVVAHMESMCPCGLPGDPSTFLWSFAWYPHAILHGLAPFYSHAAYAPTGVNLAASTTVPLIAVVMSPITLLWGPIASFNVFSIAAPALNAWAGYRLCRYVTRSPWAAMLAGAFYGFGAYDIAQLQGHMQLFVMVAPPLAVLCVLQYVDGGISRRRFTVLMTVLLTGQFYVGTEVFFTMSALGAAAFLIALAFAPAGDRRRLTSILPPLAVSYAITLVLGAYYLHVQLELPPAGKNVGLAFPTDLLAFVVPEPFTWLEGQRLATVSSMFSGSQSETDAYLGLPMILIAIRYLTTRWNAWRSRYLTIVLAVTTLWILGGHLYVGGKETIGLPYYLFEHLPLFDEVLQGRIAMYLELECALVLAMWLASPSKHQALRWACGMVAVIAILPNLLHVYPANRGTWSNPLFFKTSMYKRYIRPGASILPIRWFGINNASMMWQAEDRFYWNLADGYFTAIPVGWGPSETENDLYQDTPQTGLGQLLKAYLIRHKVSYVVVDPAEMAKWSGELATAGLHGRSIGGINLYRVPQSWFPDHGTKPTTD